MVIKLTKAVIPTVSKLGFGLHGMRMVLKRLKETTLTEDRVDFGHTGMRMAPATMYMIMTT